LFLHSVMQLLACFIRGFESYTDAQTLRDRRVLQDWQVAQGGCGITTYSESNAGRIIRQLNVGNVDMWAHACPSKCPSKAFKGIQNALQRPGCRLRAVHTFSVSRACVYDSPGNGCCRHCFHMFHAPHTFRDHLLLTQLALRFPHSIQFKLIARMPALAFFTCSPPAILAP
jgi:hypothetical protein